MASITELAHPLSSLKSDDAVFMQKVRIDVIHKSGRILSGSESLFPDPGSKYPALAAGGGVKSH